MHTVELLDEAIAVAQQLGYAIRHEWMGGVGGACEVGGKRCLFVDLSLTTDEQLDLVIDSIKTDQGVHTLHLSPAMAHLLDARPATQERHCLDNGMLGAETVGKNATDRRLLHRGGAGEQAPGRAA